MSNDEINIAIAEACGWERIKPAVTFDGRPITVGDVPGIAQDISKEIPDFCADLNAMHEAEESLNPLLRPMFVNELTLPIKAFQDFSWCAVHATARQRAEAFLRTLGKWRGG